MKQSLVLASSSVYRQQLLNKLGLKFIAESPHVDETALEAESPHALALRLAELKARALMKRYSQHLIIGSDQVALLDGVQLCKPNNKENAMAQLSASSGRCVEFISSVCVFNSQTQQLVSDIDICRVTFKILSVAQIARYVELEQPFDCAGSFKSEGLGIVLFERIVGEDPNSLVGLPLIKLVNLLAKFGVELP